MSMLSCFLRDPARAQKKWNKQTEAINVPNVGGETWETKCASGPLLNIELGGRGGSVP